MSLNEVCGNATITEARTISTVHIELHNTLLSAQLSSLEVSGTRGVPFIF
jgi:hypothetical protein